MTFKVRSTNRWHDEDVIKDYPVLHNFGFKFEKGFAVGDPDMVPTIQLNSLEELMKFMQSVKSELVIDSDGWIEIYDGYRE